MNKTNLRIAVVVVLLVLATALAACGKDKTPNQQDIVDEPVKAKGIALTVSRMAMTVGSETKLDYSLVPAEAEGEVTFESSDDKVAVVSPEGVITAKGAGVTTLKVKSDDKYAECRVVVGDLIVSKSASILSRNGGQSTAEAIDVGILPTVADGSLGGKANLVKSTPITTVVGNQEGKIYGSVQQAVDQATEGQTVVIAEGDYGETVSIGKSITLMGIDNPTLKGATVTAGKPTLDNLSFSGSAYPAEGSATVHINRGAGAIITNCFFNITDKSDPSGGYAVLADKESAGLTMQNNTLSNYRYGVYVCPTDKEVVVKNNRLSHMTTGVGVDVRQQNTDRDYPTSGSISGNQYNEVERHTQFFHYAETYDGDLDFEDNEEENATNGQSDTGGSGLLE